jgi:hypothetical protein
MFYISSIIQKYNLCYDSPAPDITEQNTETGEQARKAK